ncbi:hypothetical protein SETIT_5G334900v2 [Setaria italica]|uniref:Late embryogenesis abundant protein LEA-2 subgroup domain-containing protein n=2 Tax=Setaria TaxID=4554 RepID=K3XQX4_SETIT|nr:hypothetical protein SETIT_5G334900v2 [Setaria italica]TKW17035.1 hypothetical protein SEVIR_5G339100v2 [Setaria viridis]
MCLGVDLEAAARPADYYDIFADPRDDEAPPVWGYRAPGCLSRLNDEDRICLPWLLATCLVMASLLAGFYTYTYISFSPPSFAVDLAGYGGLDPARPGRVVSPAFGVTLRMNRTCADRADVVVAYAGVALGWGRAAPWDCEGKRRTKDVEVVAKGEGVGLPARIRDRMAAEWGRSGTLELDVDVVVFDSSGSHLAAGDFPQKVMTGKVRLGGERSEPLPLAWYALDDLSEFSR